MKRITFFLCICTQICGLGAMETDETKFKLNPSKRNSNTIPPVAQAGEQKTFIPSSPKTEARLNTFSLRRRSGGAFKPAQSKPESQT